MSCRTCTCSRVFVVRNRRCEAGRWNASSSASGPAATSRGGNGWAFPLRQPDTRTGRMHTMTPQAIDWWGPAPLPGGG
jgi:hypothetical protein